jgi:arsenite methyltransferase
MNKEDIKKAVKEGYSRIVKREASCYTEVSCCSTETTCCGSTGNADMRSQGLGYSDEELQSVPEGANLGLGCGNPTALASLEEGETVLDLGSGAGFDCFLAANRVGKKGKVIGVDMTPEMVKKAQDNARKGGYKNVEFKHGDIEELPVANNHVDVVISNCVINLSPDKDKTFMEMYRVLKPGGKFFISDIVLLNQLPGIVTDSVAAYIGCVAGAIVKLQYIKAIEAAGFKEITVLKEDDVSIDSLINDPVLSKLIQNANIPPEDIASIGSSVKSILITGRKSDVQSDA